MKNFMTILLASVLTVLFFACEDAINSEDNIIKNEKLISAKDSVEILAHPNTDFGKVTIGSSFTVEYKIINESEKHKITIYSFEIENTAQNEFQFAPIDLPVTLGYGDTLKIITIFTPSTAGAKEVNMIINNVADAKIKIKGEGDELQSSDVLDFGQVEIGTAKEMAYAFTNSSGSDINITVVRLEDADGNIYTKDVYINNVAESDLPVQVLAGDEFTGKISFYPTEPIYEEAYLIIESDVLPDRKIHIKGYGIEPVIDFGEVQIGDRGKNQYMITNHTNSDLIISSLEISDYDAQEFVLYSDALPIVIKPGEAYYVPMELFPTSEGSKEAYLYINGVRTAKLIGNSTLLIIDFGDVQIGDDSKRDYTITNNSDDVLVINALEIKGDNDQEFYVNTVNVPSIISPGESLDIYMVFTPISEGSKEAYLYINGIKTAKLIGSAYL